MVKPIARGFLLFMLIVALAIGAGALWLKRGVRDMQWAKPWVLHALNPADAPYNITYATGTMDWRHFSQLGHLRLTNLSINQRDGKIFAVIPEVEVTVDPLGFLPHHRGLNSIAVNAPKLFLTRGADGTMRLGLAGTEETLPLNDLLGFFSSGDSNSAGGITLPFRGITITHALFTLQDSEGKTILTSAPFTFHVGKAVRNNMYGMLDMPFVYHEQTGQVHAALGTLLASHDRLLNIQLDQFPIELACLFANCAAGTDVKGNVSGKADLRFDRDGMFESAGANLRLQDVVFTNTELFPEPLEISQGTVVAGTTNGGKVVTLNNVHLKLKDAEAFVQLAAMQGKDGWWVKGTAQTPRLDITKLYKYWPLPLAPDSRAWVISKLKVGYGNEATARFDVSPQELKERVFNDASLAADIRAENITVDYLPGFPEVKGVNGHVHFTGRTIGVTANSGTLLSGSTLSAATLDMPDLIDPKMPMKTDLTVNAPAGDAAALLALKPFTFDDGWHLDAKKVNGTVDAVMKLGFNSFSGDAQDDGQLHLDHVDYDITATLKDIAQAGLFNRDIHALNGTVRANNKTFGFDGKLALGETGVALKVMDDEKGHTTADISGSVPRKEFAALGLPDRPQFGEGSIGIDASLLVGKESVAVKRAAVDFTDLAMDLPEVSWSKKRGEKAGLLMNATDTAGSYNVSFSGRDLKAPGGTLTLTDAGDLASLSLPQVTSDLNDFSLDYTSTADGFTVDLKGKKLDAAASYARSDNGLLADFPPITLHLNLETLVLVEAAPFHQVKGQLSCNKLRCDSAELTGTVGKAALKGTITREQNKRQLRISASNAGDFIQALAISDRLHDGSLNLYGSYDDSKQPAMFGGKLIIKDFTLKNSEVLGRLLSVASVTGLANALTGSGIAFDRMVADIYHRKGVVTMDNGRASGTSLGITVGGTVDTTTTNLDLKGVLVPAYMLNNIITKIPLLGKLAGDKGEGLFAFNYAISGKYSDPKVSVNPLSGLAPGFLRGIFGASNNGVKEDEKPIPPYPGDRPAPAAEKKPVPKEAAPATDETAGDKKPPAALPTAE